MFRFVLINIASGDFMLVRGPDFAVVVENHHRGAGFAVQAFQFADNISQLGSDSNVIGQ